MRTINYYIQDANNKINDGIKAERDYCCKLTKDKHNPSAELRELLQVADLTYKKARQAVKKVYELFGLNIPKMKTIYMVEISMNIINSKYMDFWEDLANSTN